eukprot:TRINITY_DN87280_c0_g1_i1.p1 TRINITY_DN87280_c0_g1~~TRINITY_DN87280_c0_g1_i1.p1  ORF type:complete len:532 (-),score=76.94 TRINITY_DN87280_c0_g1_i1:43-1638(-)
MAAHLSSRQVAASSRKAGRRLVSTSQPVWKRSLEVLASRHRNGEADVVSYSKAIGSCGRGKRWDYALALLEEVKSDSRLQVDAVFCTAVIAACRHAAAWAPALAVLHSMESGSLGLFPSVPHYGAAAASCDLASKWAQALALLPTLQNRGFSPNVKFCGAIISSCEKARQWERALWLLHSMKNLLTTPDIFTHNAAMSACGKGGRWRDALRLLRDLPLNNLAPTVVSYSAVISALERKRQWELAIALLEEMHTERHEADHITWNSVISACESGEQWAAAFCLLRAADVAARVAATDKGFYRQRLEPGYNSTLSACAKGRQWQMCLTLLDSMRADQDGSTKSGLQASMPCYNSILLGLSAGQWKVASWLFEDLQRNHGADLMSLRATAATLQAGGQPRLLFLQAQSIARHLAMCCGDRTTGSKVNEESEEYLIEAVLAAGALRSLGAMPHAACRMMARRQEAPATRALQVLAFRSKGSLEGVETPAGLMSPHGRIHDPSLDVSSSIGSAYVRWAIEDSGLLRQQSMSLTSYP